jgi:hypothetical protein
MLVVEEAVEIRVLRRQGKSIREIARTLDVVVMRLRPAKISHYAVAEVLRHMPAEALDRLRRRALLVSGL